MSSSPSPTWPRVAVVGAGAVGSYFGGMLARAGAQVTLIGRAQHVDVWTREGLFLDSVHFQQRIPIAASTDIASARDADLILFCVKSPDTENAARQLAPNARPDALVISLQNGVDNVARIRAVPTPDASTNPANAPNAGPHLSAALDPIASVVYVGASMPTPGRVKHAARGDLLIGDLPGRAHPPRNEALTCIATCFEAAGVPCRISPDIEVDLWTKLITNAALNPISALAHVTYADTIATPDARETVRLLVNECVAVARAGHVALPKTIDYVKLVWEFAEKVGRVYASTAQDLERGKRTEIDALNGFIVRRGTELGVPTPINQTLLALIKLREKPPTSA